MRACACIVCTHLKCVCSSRFARAIGLADLHDLRTPQFARVRSSVSRHRGHPLDSSSSSDKLGARRRSVWKLDISPCAQYLQVQWAAAERAAERQRQQQYSKPHINYVVALRTPQRRMQAAAQLTDQVRRQQQQRNWSVSDRRCFTSQCARRYTDSFAHNSAQSKRVRVA